MVIKIKLYGKLGKKVKGASKDNGLPSTIRMEVKDSIPVFELLNKLEIDEKEISHIFVNNVYVGIGTQIFDGDRIGLFPTNMAIIFAEIPDINSIQVNLKILGDFEIYGKREFGMKIPKGSTLNLINQKLSKLKKIPKHKINLNGRYIDDLNYILNSNDTVEILSD